MYVIKIDTKQEIKTYKKGQEKLITPKGTLLFASINGREAQYQGQPTGRYEITLELTEDEYNKVRENLVKVWEDSQEYKDVKDIVDVMNPALGIKKKKDKDGNIHYRLHAKTYAYKKDSKEPNVVPILDGVNSRLPDNTEIVNGSLGRLDIWPKPFNTGGQYGLSLRLNRIQLTKMGEGNFEPFPVEEDFETEEEPF